MVVLGGGAVAYERGTLLHDPTQGPSWGYFKSELSMIFLEIWAKKRQVAPETTPIFQSGPWDAPTKGLLSVHGLSDPSLVPEKGAKCSYTQGYLFHKKHSPP